MELKKDVIQTTTTLAVNQVPLGFTTTGIENICGLYGKVVNVTQLRGMRNDRFLKLIVEMESNDAANNIVKALHRRPPFKFAIHLKDVPFNFGNALPSDQDISLQNDEENWEDCLSEKERVKNLTSIDVKTDLEVKLGMFDDDYDNDDLYDDLKEDDNIAAETNTDDKNDVAEEVPKKISWLHKQELKVEDLLKHYELGKETDINENDDSDIEDELTINVDYPTDLNLTTGMGNNLENKDADRSINWQSKVDPCFSIENDATTQLCNEDFDNGSLVEESVSVEKDAATLNHEDLDNVSLVEAEVDLKDGVANQRYEDLENVSMAEAVVNVEDDNVNFINEDLDNVFLVKAEVDLKNYITTKSCEEQDLEVDVDNDAASEERIIPAKNYYNHKEFTEEIDFSNQKVIYEAKQQFGKESFDHEDMIEETKIESFDDHNISFAESDKETVVEFDTSNAVANKLSITKEEFDQRMCDFENEDLEDFWNNNVTDDSFDDHDIQNTNFEHNQHRYHEDVNYENQLDEVETSNYINETEKNNNIDTNTNNDIVEHEFIKPFELKDGETIEVEITDYSRFPDIFLVLPVENAKAFQELEKNLSTLENVQPMTNPRVGISCLVKVDQSYFLRANIIQVYSSGLYVKVELVDYGHTEEEILETDVYNIPSHLWSEYSWQARVSLHIPQDNLWSNEDNHYVLNLINVKNIHWSVSMEIILDGIQYVNLYMEHRRKASVFHFQNILQNICDCEMKPKVISNRRDSIQIQETAKEKTCNTTEVSTNTPKNWKEEESPNDKLHTEEQMAVPDSPPPKEDYGLQDYLDYPYVTCSTRLQQEQLFVEDFIQTQIDEEESYMMVDFGEFSNQMLLVPCQPSMDYHQLEKVMLESSFYPLLTREIQVREVLAVPKKYYNRTKFVRAVVLKIKGDKLKVRGLDFSYRCYVDRSNVRMLSPDSISIPLKCICVNLHHVDKVERQRFKPFLTSLLNRLLSKPLSVTLKSRDPSIRISEAGSGEVEPNTWTPNVILQTHETEGSFCTINLLLQHELNRPLPKELLGLSEPVDSSSLKSSSAPPTPEKIITKFISVKHFQSLQIGKEYEVVILQIFSPSQISVLPVHKMEEVTRRVHKYNKRASMQQDFLLDDDNSNGVQLGQVCMARSQDDVIWYRAIVVAVPNPHAVKVLLLDTGVLRKVPSASLKKLNQEYAKNFSVYFCSLAEGWDECAEETWGNVRPTKVSGSEQMKLTWQGSLSAAHKSQHNNENLSRLLKEEARKLLPESSHQILKIVNVDRALHTVEVSSFQQ